MTGHYDEAHAHVDDARRLLRRTAGSMWLAPLHGNLVELADARRRHRRGPQRGRAGTGDGVRRGGARLLFARALPARAAGRGKRRRSGRARSRTRPPSRTRVGRGRALAERLRELAGAAGGEGTRSPRWWRTSRAWTPRWRASRAALSRSYGARPATLNEAIGNRVGMRLRPAAEAEAQLETGGGCRRAAARGALDRRGVRRGSRCATPASTLARRARIALGRRDRSGRARAPTTRSA